MIKKNVINLLTIIFIVFFSTIFSAWTINAEDDEPMLNNTNSETYNSTNSSSKAPAINCVWLPWCEDAEKNKPTPANLDRKNWQKWIWNIISELIKYVSVVAVISLMFSWVLYMTSGWEEEKTKKAKNWIIWSLVWVFLSISAWWIINMLNAIKIP